MAEYDAAQVDRIARVVLFTEWRRQVEAGHLTRDGLIAVWGRLDPQGNEFFPGEDLDEMRWLLASALGIEPGDRPDAEPPPDYPPDDLPPPRW